MTTLEEQAKHLLSYPTDEVAAEYHKELISRLKASDRVEVRLDAGDGRGKGIFAVRNIKAGDDIFREKCVVGCQDNENRSEAQVCAHCYKFTGTVESQIARHLLGNVARHEALLQEQQRRRAEFQARAAAKQAGGGAAMEGAAMEGEDDDEEDGDLNEDEQEELEELQAKVKKIGRIGTTQLEALLSGALQLPGSEKIKLPVAIPCRRECGEEFCSTACEQAAWDQCHAVLCPCAAPSTSEDGNGKAAAAPAAAAGSDAAPADPSQPGTSGSAAPSSSAPEVLSGIRIDRQALRAFHDHAHSTNSIFVLAAKVIIVTVLKAHALLAAAAAGEGAEAAPAATADAAWGALQAAWLPFAMGWKGVWWRSVARPADVEPEDEGKFRQELEDLATESLDLLKQALVDERFPAIFSLEVYGGIVGMFELNNLGIEVLSPLADYFEMLDNFPKARKMAAKKVTQPFKDALGEDYDAPCEGTGFFCLQSCANHSCLPNAEAETDPLAGITVISATKAIKKGEEILITYIDSEAPYEERVADLKDYGFVCACSKCVKQGQKAAAL